MCALFERGKAAVGAVVDESASVRKLLLCYIPIETIQTSFLNATLQIEARLIPTGDEGDSRGFVAGTDLIR